MEPPRPMHRVALSVTKSHVLSRNLSLVKRGTDARSDDTMTPTCAYMIGDLLNLCAQLLVLALFFLLNFHFSFVYSLIVSCAVRRKTNHTHGFSSSVSTARRRVKCRRAKLFHSFRLSNKVHSIGAHATERTIRVQTQEHQVGGWKQPPATITESRPASGLLHRSSTRERPRICLEDQL